MAHYDDVDEQITKWEKANRSHGGGGGGASVVLPSIKPSNAETKNSAEIMSWPGGPLLVDPSVDDAIKAWEDSMNAKKKAPTASENARNGSSFVRKRRRTVNDARLVTNSDTDESSVCGSGSPDVRSLDNTPTDIAASLGGPSGCTPFLKEVDLDSGERAPKQAKTSKRGGVKTKTNLLNDPKLEEQKARTVQNDTIIATMPDPPDTTAILKGMSVLLNYMVLQTEAQLGRAVEGDLREDLHDYLVRLYKVCQWTEECNLLAFVYLLRLLANTVAPVQLRRDNCKLLMLGTLMIAQKFWDDRSLRNQDMPVAWQRATTGEKRVNLKQVNSLEIEILRAIEWELYVSECDYVACYQELTSLVGK